MKDALLIVLAPGVGREDLAGAATPFLAERLGGCTEAARLFTPLGRSPLDELFGQDLVATLHRFGLAVDRRTWLLRPHWQGDDAAMRSLEHRGGERPHVTFLYLSDVAHAAVVHGPGSPAHLAALRNFDARIERALELLRSYGEEPDLALLAFGTVRRVERCFDPAPALARALATSAWLRRNRASATITAGRLELVCRSWNQVEELAQVLQREPFTNHGRLLGAKEVRALGLALPAEALWYVPARGVALGKAGQRGMLPLFPAAPGELGCALLPWLTEACQDLDLAVARAGLVAHARSLARRLGTADRTTLPDLAPVANAPSRALADVESVLQHDGFEVVEDAAHVDALLGVRAREE